MGQYHTIFNVTKRECISIGGARLWEKANAATAAALLLLLSNSNGRGGGDFTIYPQDYDKPNTDERIDQASIDLVSGRWAGDSIVVQGDYAEETDPAFISNRDGFENITGLVCDALLICHDGDETDISRIIESETSSGYGGFKITVSKVKGLDRNKQTVEKYTASAANPKPKRKSKRGAK